MAACDVDLASVVERGLRAAERLGASEAEVYVASARGAVISGGPRGVVSAVGGRSMLASVRVAVGRRVSAQSALISGLDGVDGLVETAVSAARASVEDSRWVSLPRRLGRSPVSDLVDDRVKHPDLEGFIRLVYDSVRMVEDLDRRVSATEVRLSLSHLVKAIGNSYYPLQESEKTLFKYYIEVKAAGDGGSSYYSYYSAPTLRGFDLEGVVGEAVRVTLETLNAKRVGTGLYDVILMPRVFSHVLASLIVPAVRADNVQTGRSPLAGRLGQRVLSEKLTVVDDGTVPDMPGSAEFDGEGVATRGKVVFESGVLRTYLYDTYTANVDGVDSTANAVRLGGTVHPDALNVLVAPGAEPVDSLARDLRRGMLVYGAIGEWLSNPISGYLSATVTNAVYVERGEPKHGVRGAVISGEVYELLGSRLSGLSKERARSSNTLVPAVMLSGVAVASE